MDSSPPNKARVEDRFVRTFNSRDIVFDREGFFNDFEDWSEPVFECLAKEEGLSVLTEKHWEVIRFLRKFYEYNGRAPLNKEFRRGSGTSLVELQRLFPGGLKTGARRLAGLPNPKTCD